MELEITLSEIPKDLEIILNTIPTIRTPPLPDDWIRKEMIERYKILKFLDISQGMNVLEIGSGHHALTTVPLAYLVGETGRVVAVEISRWKYFEKIINMTVLKGRVIPLKIDARVLPFPYKCFDYAVLIHGIRSLKTKENIIRIIKEMLRVSKYIAIAESLPIAETKAQEAHLEMYNLRSEIFLQVFGQVDDIKYFSLEELESFVKVAGGKKIKSRVIRVNTPHFLAYFPRDLIMKIKDEKRREILLEEWDRAYEKIKKYGEEHPPVGLVTAFSGYR